MKKTILIADDSPLIRNIVGSLIQDMGYHLLTASDGLSGVRQAFSSSPDLVILDISMPGINGFQACRLLKNDPLTSHIPVIILTSEKKPISQFWGKEVGADRYILKEKDSTPLSRAIKNLLKKRKKRVPLTLSEQDEFSEMKILEKVSRMCDRELIKSTLRKMELESILQNTNEAIVLIDKTNMVREINKFGIELFGLNKKNWVGMTISDIFPHKDFLTFNSLISHSESNRSKTREITYRTVKKNHTLLIDFSLINNFQSEIEAIVIFFRDITYLKEIERLKAEYFYHVVQEIRNPLTSAKEAINFLLEDAPGKLSKIQSSVLKIVDDDVKRLVRLTDSMINISEMELSPALLNMEKIDIASLIASSIEKNKKMAGLKNLKWKNKMPAEKLTIHGDREKLTEVFSNILSNSVKYNKTYGSIFISASPVRKNKKDFVRVKIRDTGTGIAQEELRLLFDKEKKVDARLRKKGGEFGLSMAITKMILDLHQSIIEVKSTSGKGTSFTVWLAMNLPASAENHGCKAVTDTLRQSSTGRS